MKKFVFALVAALAVASPVLAAPAQVQPVKSTVNGLNIGVVAGVQAVESLRVDDVKGDVGISNQAVGVNIDVTSAQPVGKLDINAGNAGLVLGVQLVGPMRADKVGGNVSIGQTTVGANVAVDLRKVD